MHARCGSADRRGGLNKDHSNIIKEPPIYFVRNRNGPFLSFLLGLLSLDGLFFKFRLNMFKKYPVCLLLLLIMILSGCATWISDVERASSVKLEQPVSGSLQNPIIDSNITLSEALKKYAPPELKAKQGLVELLYYSFDGKIHQGQLLIDKRLIKDIREVFGIALESKFPIASVILISSSWFLKDGKWNDDNQSMLANNTSAFNYRKVTGGKSLSRHAYGFAIDINPVQNPYIKGGIVLPPNAVYDIRKLGTLSSDSSVVKSFIRLGWTWGGNWKSLKDYQHFEKVISN